MTLTRVLVRAGIAGQVAFAVTFLAEDATRPGFQPWRRWVSHLSLGPHGWINTVGLAVAGATAFAAALGARRGAARTAASRLLPPAVAVYALGMAAAAAFPIDPGLGWPPGAEPRHTFSGQLHDLSGLLVFAGLTASAWAGRYAFGSRREGGSRWRRWSTIAGLVVPASFLICCVLVSLDYSGAWHGAPSGLFERIALLTGMAWLVTYLVRHDKVLTAAAPCHEPDHAVSLPC
jgi:hypothetical protein